MRYKLYKEFKIYTLGISMLHKLTLLCMFNKNSKNTDFLTIHSLSCDCPLIVPYMSPAQVLHSCNHQVDTQKSVFSLKVLYIYMCVCVCVCVCACVRACVCVYIYIYKTTFFSGLECFVNILHLLRCTRRSI